MIEQIILFIAGGIVLGCITGMLPGIHINLVMVMFFSASFIPITTFSPFALASGIIALTITHTLVDVIPAIYLGAPEETTALTVLPGHQLLKQGLGLTAVKLTLLGAIIGFIATIALLPFFWKIAPLIEQKIIHLLPFLILGISLYTIMREDQVLKTLTIFILASFLGYITLHLPVKEPLFPLLSGLFGLSGLILSIKEKTTIPKQKSPKEQKIKAQPQEIIKNTFWGTLVAAPCAILPALGTGYAATMAAELKKQTSRTFLFITGLVNMIVTLSSLILIYSIGKARTGSAAMIKKVIPELVISEVVLLVFVATLSLVSATLITLQIAKYTTRKIALIEYNRVSRITFLFILAIIILISGFQGLIIATTAAALGIYCIQSGIKRIHMMAALIIPTALYYLF